MKILFFAVFLAIGAVESAHGECGSIKDLSAVGFRMHGKFNYEAWLAFKGFERDLQYYVKLEDRTYIDASTGVTLWESLWDDVRTSEKIGDIFLLWDDTTHEIHELRWWDQGRRHVAWKACPAIRVPMDPFRLL